MSHTKPMIVLCPHFEPDTAPTGTVMTRIVEELVALGHRVHVVTALPWYRAHRIEDGWTGRWVRREVTPWGSITRVHPFPGDDRSNLLRRAVGFVGYSMLAGFVGVRAGGWFRRADAVIAMSPPLTLGLTGKMVAVTHRATTASAASSSSRALAIRDALPAPDPVYTVQAMTTLASVRRHASSRKESTRALRIGGLGSTHGPA